MTSEKNRDTANLIDKRVGNTKPATIILIEDKESERLDNGKMKAVINVASNHSTL